MLRIQKHRRDTAHRLNAAVRFNSPTTRELPGLRFDHSGGADATSDSKIKEDRFSGLMQEGLTATCLRPCEPGSRRADLALSLASASDVRQPDDGKQGSPDL